MNTLSVVIPVFNGAEFLPTCIESVKRNHQDGYEFIFVDDHSTDATPQILDEARHNYPFITHLRNAENQGVAKSRNNGHELVNSRFLTYLDADDWYAPGHLEALVKAIEDLEVDFLRTDHVKVEGVKRTVIRAPEERRGFAFPSDSVFGEIGSRSLVNYLYIWAGIYDLARIDHNLLGFNENLRTASDRPWLWRMYLETETTATIGLNTYFYRKTTNPTALTQAGNPHTLHFLDASHEILDMAEASGNQAAVDKAVYSACRIVDFHVARRNRLTPELRYKLYESSSELLNACPFGPLEESIETFAPHQRVILRRILALRSES